MRALTQVEIDKVIEGLQGTCMSVDEAINMYIDDENIQGRDDITNEEELCQQLDNNLFLCSKCGWWYEAGYWVDDSMPGWNPEEETCLDCGGDE